MQWCQLFGSCDYKCTLFFFFQEYENKLRHDVKTLTANTNSLSSQINTLKTVPALFGVVEFWLLTCWKLCWPWGCSVVGETRLCPRWLCPVLKYSSQLSCCCMCANDCCWWRMIAVTNITHQCENIHIILNFLQNLVIPSCWYHKNFEEIYFLWVKISPWLVKVMIMVQISTVKRWAPPATLSWEKSCEHRLCL